MFDERTLHFASVTFNVLCFMRALVLQHACDRPSCLNFLEVAFEQLHILESTAKWRVQPGLALETFFAVARGMNQMLLHVFILQ